MDDFKSCLKNKKIIKFSGIKKKVAVEIKASKEDLSNSQAFLRQKRYKYATIAGYYSIFHAARGMLYSKGYREKSHYCLGVAVKELFKQEKIINPSFFDVYDDAMGLREAADYQSLYSEFGAKQTVSGAKKFLQVASKVLS